jgi:hypothetical protein
LIDASSWAAPELMPTGAASQTFSEQESRGEILSNIATFRNYVPKSIDTKTFEEQTGK